MPGTSAGSTWSRSRRGRAERTAGAIELYDTTLRDGSQQEGLSLTVDDKLRVAEQLDHLGVQFIEGGWPGANPKDEEFFRRAAAGELQLHTATMVAFGSTRKANTAADRDPVLQNLLDAQTTVVCLVAKSAEWHVTETLRTTLTDLPGALNNTNSFLGQTNQILAATAPFRQYVHDVFPALDTSFADTDANGHNFWSVYSVNCEPGSCSADGAPSSYTPSAPIDVWAAYSSGGGQ